MAEVRDVYYPLGITFLVLNTLGVALRYWARYIKKAVGYDDMALLLSYVGFVLFIAMEFVAIYYGIGVAMTELEPHHNPMTAAKYFTIASIVDILGSGISKIGVGLVLHRLSSGADMGIVRMTLVVAMAVMGVASLAVAIIFGIQCRPLPAAWGEGTGECLSPTTIGQAGIALSAIDVAVSWLFALLPVFMLWKAQLKTKIKITIMVLLGLGAVSSVATIVRLKYVIEISALTGKGSGIAAAEILQSTLEATIYSMVEIGLSIFAATLTALRPLIKRIPCMSDFSSGGRTPSKGLSGSHPLSSGHNDIHGPGYRLDDMPPSDGDSEENIIAPRVMDIHKSSRVEVAYQKGAKHGTMSDFHAKETHPKLGWNNRRE